MELTRTTLDQLRQLVHDRCGLALGDEKAYLFEHRLGPVLDAHGFRSYEELVAASRGAAGSRLADEITEHLITHETSFFRDTHPFEVFRDELLPAAARRAARTGRRVRIWSAGVSTGQEAYSLAMIVHDFVRPTTRSSTDPVVEVSIVASDVSPTVLSAAQTARYKAHEVARGLTPGQLERFFERAGRDWQLRGAVREMVEFRPVNLIRPLTGLGGFDVIFCRNVLIYFDEPTRRAVCEQFLSLLDDDGHLILGAAENLYGIDCGFVSSRIGATIVYRKT